MGNVVFEGRGYTKLAFAEQKAQDASKTEGVIYVIKAKVWDEEAQQHVFKYFCDKSGFIRNGEELKSTWEKGKRAKD